MYHHGSTVNYGCRNVRLRMGTKAMNYFPALCVRVPQGDGNGGFPSVYIDRFKLCAFNLGTMIHYLEICLYYRG